MKRAIRFLICLCVLVLSITQAGASGVLDSLCTAAGIDNPHVAAWLEIPEAGLSLPVMQHPQEDAYYSKHDAKGNDWALGCLYTQHSYNAADFTDPVTIIYGSSASRGAPLRDLQELFSGRFDELRLIRLHLPEGTQEYRTFAAVPYSSIHILHYYDFHSQRRFNGFFDSVFSTRALGMHLDEDDRPEPENDRVLILSTSLRGDKTQRYLVMAKLVTPEK